MTTHVDPSKTREDRIAANRARRNTPEWRADGASLTERRRATEEAAHQAEANRRRQIAQERRDEKPVTDVELDRAVKQCEASIREAAAEYRYDHDDYSETDAQDLVAYDIVTAVCFQFRSKLAAEVKRVMLGITPDDEVPLPW